MVLIWWRNLWWVCSLTEDLLVWELVQFCRRTFLAWPGKTASRQPHGESGPLRSYPQSSAEGLRLPIPLPPPSSLAAMGKEGFFYIRHIWASESHQTSTVSMKCPLWQVMLIRWKPILALADPHPSDLTSCISSWSTSSPLKSTLDGIFSFPASISSFPEEKWNSSRLKDSTYLACLGRP